MPKKVLIALPPAMLMEVDMIAEKEHRTRSDLIRESLRRYIESYKRNSVSHSHSLDGKPPDVLVRPYALTE